MCLIFEIIVLIIPKWGIWKNTLAIRNFALVVNRLNDFQFLYYIMKLTKFLRILNEKLLFVESVGEKRNMLKLVGKFYNEIWEISDLLNKRFGLTIICTVSSNFLALVISTYWMFNHTYFKFYSFKNICGTISSVNCFFPPTITLILLCFVCSRCCQQVKIIFK